RLIQKLDRPPPKKLPTSAARNGAQKPRRLCSRSNPLLAKYTANQSPTKNQYGSIKNRPRRMPQVCRYLSSLGQLTEGKVTLGENGLLSPALSSSPESVRGAGGEGKDFG